MSDDHGLSAALGADLLADHDLVQLLTPEGERVEHPEFSSDRTTTRSGASTATWC